MGLVLCHLLDSASKNLSALGLSDPSAVIWVGLLNDRLLDGFRL